MKLGQRISLLALVSLVSLAQISPALAQVPKYNDLPNFHKVKPYLYRGAMPSPDGIKALRTIGVDTIVDFRNDPLGVALEAHVARTLNMKYINIPTGNAPPSEKKIKAFLSAVQDTKDRRDKTGDGAVFVHCHAGCDRTGFYVSMWRLFSDKWTPPVAFLEMLRYGFVIHRWKFPVKSDFEYFSCAALASKQTDI
ncbi:tyrosine-protein phosphatase [bacterium]|nr:tyrosine-protein phosphatase [bacterium]QQR56383.1 MAG: tyrosine-protein phosphatase [Candidatus Melainabacteria bacterium]